MIVKSTARESRKLGVSGGIGRHDCLKSSCLTEHVGSSPMGRNEEKERKKEKKEKKKRKKRRRKKRKRRRKSKKKKRSEKSRKRI